MRNISAEPHPSAFEHIERPSVILPLQRGVKGIRVVGLLFQPVGAREERNGGCYECSH